MSFENLNLESVDVEEGDLDSLLRGIPAATVTAETLQHGKAPEEENNENPFESKDDFNLDNILNNSEDDKEKETTEETDKKVETEVKTPTPAEQKVETKTTKATKGDELSDTALKQITDFYIDKGLWKDFEGRDEMEYDAESFQDILVQQNEKVAKEKFDEILDSAGPIGKAIIDHITKGGKPDEIIDLFKEQKEATEFVPESPEEKKRFIAEYYHKVHGFSNEKIKRIVNAAEVDDTLDEEIDEIKTSYEKYYSKELQRIEEDRETYVQKQKELEDKFQNDITTEILARKNISDKDKQYLKETILNYDQKLPDGTKVSKFYLKFAEMQNNIPDYIDFVQFVLDKNKFIEKIRKVEETKATEKAFFKIKKNSTISDKNGSTHLEVNTTKEQEPFKWF